VYTFYSSIIKCNYLYFLVYIIAFVQEAIGVAGVRVGCIANICITRSGTMHLTLTCEIRDSRIVQRILYNLRMMIVACYLIFGSCVSFIRDLGNVTLLFTGTLISGV
jgi:hypothetical protein